MEHPRDVCAREALSQRPTNLAEWVRGVCSPHPQPSTAGPCAPVSCQRALCPPSTSPLHLLESVHPSPAPRLQPDTWAWGLAGKASSRHLGRNAPSPAPSIVTAPPCSSPADAGGPRLHVADRAGWVPGLPWILPGLPHPHTSPFNWAFSLTESYTDLRAISVNVGTIFPP